MFKSLTRLLAAASLVALGSTGAGAATYNIAWTGSAGWTMTGLLMFSDSLLNTGVIDESDIDDLAIEVFLAGASQGSRSLSADGAGTTAASFNLNFDTTAGQFLTGGSATSGTGQSWFTAFDGSVCDTVGFASGTAFQGACATFGLFGPVQISQSTLTASFVAPVPLPAALPLFLAGLAGLGLFGRLRSRR